MALNVNMPDTPFENFDEFHAWYLGEVDKNLPVSIQEVLNAESPSSYSAMLPHWSDEQEAEIYAYVEKMVFPTTCIWSTIPSARRFIAVGIPTMAFTALG